METFTVSCIGSGEIGSVRFLYNIFAFGAAIAFRDVTLVSVFVKDNWLFPLIAILQAIGCIMLLKTHVRDPRFVVVIHYAAIVDAA